MTRRWLLVLISSGLLACGSEVESTTTTSLGEANVAEPRRVVPDFRLPRLGGGEVALEDLRGRILVLDFWATWCLPCEETVPELNAFFEAHREEGIEVYGISIDEGAESVVAEWIAEHGVRYPILLSDSTLAQRFGAPGYPATFVVAPDGTVEELHVGYFDRADLERSLVAVRAYSKAVDKLEAQASPGVGRSPKG